jgi:hypothetical protein
VALLPLWRPVGPAGVPFATLSHAPQGIAVTLRALTADESPFRRIWNPQLWGSWLEWAVPSGCYATDSRIELFPPDVWADASQLGRGDGEWLSILDEREAWTIVLSADEVPELEPVLEASSAWRLEYRDADGSIWVRSTPMLTGPVGCPERAGSAIVPASDARFVG